MQRTPLKSPRRHPFWRFLFGLLLALLSGLTVAGLFSPGALASNPKSLGYALACGFFGLPLGLGLLVSGVREELALWHVAPPVLTLSTQTLRVGESLTLSYQQTVRRATELKDVRMQLILRETVWHGAGRSRTHRSHDTLVQDYRLPGGHYEAGQVIQDQHDFQVQGMHSFQFADHHLDWLIHVEVEMTGVPDYAEEFPLQVAAELAE